MMFRNATRIILVLAVTAAMAQSTPSVSAPSDSPAVAVPGGSEVMQRPGYVGRKSVAGKQSRSVPETVSLHQRVQEMEARLSQMHQALRLMQQTEAKSKTKDPVAKANLDMWELTVGHFDEEFQQLKVAMAAHDDMEARRAALYKQADAKAEAGAQAARAAQAAKLGAGAPTPAASAQFEGQSSAGQSAPAQPSPAPNK